MPNEQLEKLKMYAYMNYKYRVLYNDCADMLDINKCNEMYSYDVLNIYFNLHLIPES